MTLEANAYPHGTDSLISKDGTMIGYRQFGDVGKSGLILMHGALMTSLNFTKLAVALSEQFTVYVPDRRGRGLSGSFGDDYGMKQEVEDVAALLDKTAASNIFGLSAGAVVALQAALTLPNIRRVALYEPPLPLAGRPSPTAWAARYERELGRGELAAALVTIIKGTADSSPFAALPRFLVVPLMKLAMGAEAQDATSDSDMALLRTLLPTMRYEVKLVSEMEGDTARFRAITAKVLLLGGSNSQPYLKNALDALSKVLPQAQRLELSGLGHAAPDNQGKPERVAEELKRFFTAG